MLNAHAVLLCCCAAVLLCCCMKVSNCLFMGLKIGFCYSQNAVGRKNSKFKVQNLWFQTLNYEPKTSNPFLYISLISCPIVLLPEKQTSWTRRKKNLTNGTPFSITITPNTITTIGIASRRRYTRFLMHLSPQQNIFYGFFIYTALGCVLLCLPFSLKSARWRARQSVHRHIGHQHHGA
jgi:hypothetical protein